MKSLILYCLCLSFILFGCNKKDNSELENTNLTNNVETVYNYEEETIAPINAEEYLSEIGNINSSYDVSTSEYLLTESSVIDLLTNRGFSNLTIETNYSVDGQYYDSIEISEESTETHPIYETYYISESGFVWGLSIVGDKIYANPYTYNLQDEIEVLIIISETEYFTSYDSATNKYYEVIPNDTSINLKVVAEINADLLESLTMEEINKL